jgi:hypothetical protein
MLRPGFEKLPAIVANPDDFAELPLDHVLPG